MAWLLDNPEKEYIESCKTDVMKTWRRFGFIPPSEQKVDFGESLDALDNLTIRGTDEKLRGKTRTTQRSRETQEKKQG